MRFRISLCFLCALAAANPLRSQTPIYYSVGTSTANLRSSPSLTMTISSGTATFSEPQGDIIGVGDEITYNTSNTAYISGRTSSTVYSVITATGGTPGDVTDATVDSIGRAFNSLSDAETQSSDGTHLGTGDLPGGGYQLNWPCYNDDAMDDTVRIDGYTTGSNNYIRIYTPVDTTEVGVSQRHSGVAGTGFRVAPVVTVSTEYYDVFLLTGVGRGYVRIEGIEIDGSGISNAEQLRALTLHGSVVSSDLRLDSNLIHDLTNSIVDDSDTSHIFVISIEGGTEHKLSNNIIYDATNVSAFASSSTWAIRLDDPDLAATAYIHNNTIFDIKVNVAATGTARGIYEAQGTVVAKNNYVGDVVSTNGGEFCFSGITTQSNNVSSDLTASGPGSQTNKATYGDYFVGITDGSEDLHLKSGSNALWGSYGADLDADPSLPIMSDIDRYPRHPTQPDIGADEFGSAVFYSVGIDSSDLKNASPTLTMTISAGTATFSEPQATNIGVGDEITYNGSTVAFISSLSSLTQYSVITAVGATPPDVVGATVDSIRRAFNSLSLANTGSLDVNHLNTSDLVAGNFQLNWPCYNDGPMNDTLLVTGWTTGPANYIRIYAPFRSDEVASRQRHTGVAGTGFRFAPVMATTPSPNILFWIDEEYVSVEGIEIDGTGVTNTKAFVGLYVTHTLSTTSDVRTDGCIIHDINVSDPTTTGWTHGVFVNGNPGVGATARISNNLVYDVTNPFSNNPSHVVGIGVRSDTTSYVYNNTVYRVRNTGPTAFGAAWGIQAIDWATVSAKNNYVGDVVSDNDPVDNCFDQRNGATLNQEANVSSDGTASGLGSQTGKAIYGDYFVGITDGSEDLHLRGGSNALWGSDGADLDADPSLPITDDMDGDARHPTQPDIGADEFGSVMIRSIGTNTGTLVGDDASTASVSLGSTTVTFSGVTLPAPVAVGAVGLGDLLTLDPGGGNQEVLTIISRDGDTQVTVQWAATKDHSGGESYNIKRVYNTLQAWEDAVDGDLVADNRLEIGVAYKDGPFIDDAATNRVLLINDSITDSIHYLRLIVAEGQRHNGTAGTGVVVDGQDDTKFGFMVQDDYTRIDGFEFKRVRKPFDGGGASLYVNVATNILVERLLVYDFLEPTAGQNGIYTGSGVPSSLTVRNSIIYNGGNNGILVWVPNSTITVENCTIYNMDLVGVAQTAGTLIVKNTISIDNGTDFAGTMTGSHNMSFDGTAFSLFGSDTNAITGALSANEFVSPTPSEDLHLAGTADAKNAGTDLSANFFNDIDGQLRVTPWDMGADDIDATTAVELVSFAAAALDGAVELSWETGSEIDNLGFHLYRSTEEGSYQRITSSVIPGLGSSPEGARYSYVDSGLTNGLTYYYKLEDIETTGATELHGPVSATPAAQVTVGGGGDEASEESNEEFSQSRITYGEPSANGVVIKRLGRKGMVLELRTEGFYAYPEEDGTVRLEVPGLELIAEPGEPAVPVFRGWVDALVGRKVKLGRVKAENVEAFTSLRPSSTEAPDVIGSSTGTTRAGSRKVRRAFLHKGGLYPEKGAQLISVAFQEELKKALVELAPLRWDGDAGRLLVARRLRVRVLFKGKEPSEKALGGGKGRRHVESHGSRHVLARFVTQEPGLYGVRFEDVFGRRGRKKKVSKLRLSHQGEAVAFRVKPRAKIFKRGSVLYFVSEGAKVNPYGQQAVYELEASGSGVVMEKVNAAPEGSSVSHYWKTLSREENRLYQAALVEADDVWQWDWFFGPMKRGYPFQVDNLAPVAASSELKVWLVGASDFPESPDHHVRVYVNGTLVGEDWWDGEKGRHIAAELGAGLLHEGENLLEIEDVGDTEAAYSMVMLDRYEVTYPSQLVAHEGTLIGSFHSSGAAWVSGLESGYVLDVTGAHPQWLQGLQSGATGVGFGAESGHRYLVVSRDSVLSPQLRTPKRTGLRSEANSAEYLVIGPREFLVAAEPLLRYRRNEGLHTKAVAIEDIYSEFGYGEETAESIREFLSYVYHHWSEPSLRYVLLVGDATYDTKDYLGTGVQNHVPVKLVKTRYVWTASDPWLASINGEDILPDVAIGRLPAASVDEVQVLVAKILAYENGESDPAAPVVLITDNPDIAGNFDADAEEIASTVLSGESVEKIYLTQLGTAGARSAIVNAFDEGASLVSYIGHGAIHLWANENLFNIWQVGSLTPQSQQPLLFTMNCLNGYFHFPYFNSLSEELLKAEGKGVIAAFSPTGLSLDAPAHRFHKALLEEVVNQDHERLGDAILAGQAAYADTGAFPELLSIYHLLGDPALRLP